MWLSELPRRRKRPQTIICCLEGLGRLKCFKNNLDASLSFLSTSWRCSQNWSPCRLPVSPMHNFFNKYTLCNRWHWQRSTWSDHWSQWISWVPSFSLRYQWKEKFCIVNEHIWKFQVGHRFEMNFWPKSCLCFRLCFWN